MDLQWSIDGRRFRSQEEYMAAKRDKQLIDSIVANKRLDKPKDVELIYQELKSGRYHFESVAGRQFDDNIYELHKRYQEEEQAKQQEKERKKELKKEKRNRSRLIRDKKGKAKLRIEDFDKGMQKEIMHYLHKKEKKRRLVMALSVLLCTASFGYLFYYGRTAQKSEETFAELAALKESTSQVYSRYTLKEKEIEIHRTQKEQIKAPDILPEYQALHSKNKKLIGWIKIEDTVIDYPVMQTVNNEYYLDHNYNQEKDKNGCIFMDYQCDVIEGCDNMILYGHHMQSGKMFGSLNKYSSEEYYKKHPKIQFDTIYEKGEYEVMYVFRSKVFSEEEVTFKYYQFINAASEKEFNSYMNEMKALSLYDTQVTAGYGDKLLTLSTCDYQENDGRFVVVAKKVN